MRNNQRALKSYTMKIFIWNSYSRTPGTNQYHRHHHQFKFRDFAVQCFAEEPNTLLTGHSVHIHTSVAMLRHYVHVRQPAANAIVMKRKTLHVTKIKITGNSKNKWDCIRYVKNKYNFLTQWCKGWNMFAEKFRRCTTHTVKMAHS